MDHIWTDVADKVQDLSLKPEKFLEGSDQIFETSKILTKVLYDAAKLLEDGRYKNSTLPELLIDDFDEEQVWAGVELQNVALERDFAQTLQRLATLATRSPGSLNLFKKSVNNIETSNKLDRTTSDESDEDELMLEENGDYDESNDENGDYDESNDVENDENDDEEESEDDDDKLSDIGGLNDEAAASGDENSDDDEMKKILNDPDFQHMSDSEGDDLPLFDEKSSDEEIESEEDEEIQAKKQAEREKKNKILESQSEDYLKNALKTIKSTVKGGGRGQVEDKFFKISEMEKFLESEEAKVRQENVKKNKKSEDDEDSSEDEDDSEMDLFDSRLVEKSKEDNAKYLDYFQDEVDQDEESEDEEMEADDKPSGSTKKNLLAGDSDDDGEKDLGEMKSTFEMRSAKLKKEIKKLEDAAVSTQKPWQMIGEIDAVKRPENSLLQEHLEYDHIAKQAPIVTEEVSKRLEDIIVQRIKDRAWDDVERKIKPVENPYEYKKKLILDQEKSKLSLAEVYEQEFLKQKGDLENSKKTPGMLDDLEDGPPPEVETIKKQMSTLFAKLDTLTHFHYTPRAPTADVKIIRNAPTITMEEVAPIAMSDANLLAPQEIIDKKRGEEVGATEKEETEKNRERRLKKLKQRTKQKEKEKKEKLIEKLKPGLGNKHSKKKVMRDIEKAEKEGKLVTIKSKSKAVRSSSAFFNQLQNEATAAIKEKSGNIGKKNKRDKTSSGAVFKL